MKIELKNIKHSEFASQETNCYQATIYIDGTIFGDILTSWLMSKDLKRLMSKRIVFVKEDGNVYETKALKADQLKLNLNQSRLPEMLKAKTILNLLPFEQALTIYKGATA